MRKTLMLLWIFLDFIKHFSDISTELNYFIIKYSAY